MPLSRFCRSCRLQAAVGSKNNTVIERIYFFHRKVGGEQLPSWMGGSSLADPTWSPEDVGTACRKESRPAVTFTAAWQRATDRVALLTADPARPIYTDAVTTDWVGGMEKVSPKADYPGERVGGRSDGDG